MLGEKIKELRTLQALSQQQLSEMMKISIQTICAWETGKWTPSLRHLRTLAATFNVKVETLTKLL